MKYFYKLFFVLFILLVSGEIFSQNVSQKQLDKQYLIKPGAAFIQKFKKNFTGSWNKTFVNFTDNSIYLLGGMNLSSQIIKTGSYNSSFNYNVNQLNASNGFKPGYFTGFRVDGLYKDKHNYSFGISVNKISTATNYKDLKDFKPFLGSFSNFKADNQFFNLSMSVHYKQLLSISDTSKYKFYFVFGPSVDTRLSKQSDDNLVNNNYTRFLVRGDIGLEFENKNFYTLFLHYKHAITSFATSPIKANINSFEVGMMMKASDLF